MREASLVSRGSSRARRPTDRPRPPARLPVFPKPDYLRFSTDAALRCIENWETKGAFSLSLPLSAKSPLLSLQLQLVVEFGSPSVGSPPVGSPFAWRQRRRPPLSPRLRRRPRRPRVHFLGNTAASNWDSKRRKKRLVFRLFFSFGLNLSCLPLSLFRAPPNQEEETNTRPPT